MAWFTIVIRKIGVEGLPGFSYGFISVQIDFLVFDAFPSILILIPLEIRQLVNSADVN